MSSSEPDFKALGFKCGLEIHQQLLTEKKLFCRCPVKNRNDEPDITILRHMRPTLSEMGTYDGTALMEYKTKKQILYQLFEDTVCTYEMDDTPPFPINEEALDIALQLTMLVGCKVVDELHVSRKQYLDGSIPTGFQRTAITGVEGELPYKEGRTIGIRQVSIEEDACREVEDHGHNITFKTDRLGTPLIEVVTEPDILHPSEVAEVASLIGRAMRATGKVRRGMGATRQDVNVSVEGGQRVEIKGVPKLQWMGALTANEARRQKALLEIREELKRRGVTTETFNVKKKLVTDIFRETRWTPLALAIDSGGAAGAIIMKGFHGLLGWETQEHVPFFHEFVGRARVIACLDKEPSLLDMNALERILKTDELRDLKVAMDWTNDDALILVWGPAEDVETAMREIESRALEACIGVPNETRQAFEDGTTTFERILPGPDRMYPDTDHPPVAILEERMDRIKAQIDEPAWLREKRYEALGLPERWARELSFSPWAEAFDSAVDMGIPPKRVGKALVEEIVHLRRRGVDTQSKKGEISVSLEHLRKPIPIWAWTRWVMQGMKGQPKMASVDEVREAIKNSSAVTIDGIMGDVMQLFKGWADVHTALQESKAKLGQG